MSETYQLNTVPSGDPIPEFAEKENISAIPMIYMIGDKEYNSNGFVPAEQLARFYQTERESQLTRTSQISPQGYLDCFQEYARKDQSVLYISLSSGLSGTYNTARFAAGEILE